jgi:Domain of unknown function (DUF222)
MFDPGAGPVERGAVAVLDAVDAALDAAFAVDLDQLDGRELDAFVARMGAIQARVAALDARVVGEWDAQMRWAGHGSRSAAAALAHARRIPAEACGRIPKLARKLRAFPAVRLAWEAGRIDTVHVQRICAADNRRVHDDLVADQVEVTRWAMTFA